MDNNSPNNFTDQFLQTLFNRLTVVVGIITAALGILTKLVSENTAKTIIWVGFFVGLIVYVILFYRNMRRLKEQYTKIEDLPRSGLRGLLPFEEGDQLFGRNQDIMGLAAITNDRDFQYGVLSGDSGCGKTSLVRAGILPQLRKNNIIPLYISSPAKDPKERIKEYLKQEFADKVQNSKDVFQELDRLAKSEKKKVIIILDQFEEFFILNRSRETRSSFAKWLSNTIQSGNKHLCFLFVVRRDFFSDLHSFYPIIQDPIPAKYTYLLHDFDVELSKEVLLLLAKTDGISLSEALAQTIVEDLESYGVVRPAELQIVGSQVVRKRILTTRQFQNAGGTDGILSSYISESIKYSPDQRISSAILRLMCSENGITKSPKDRQLEEIVDMLDSGGVIENYKVNENLIQNILQYFVHSRIVILNKEGRYNLVHDYLAPRIFDATKESETANEHADRLLKKYIALFRDNNSVKIPPQDYRQIIKYASDDLKKDGTASQLLLASRGGQIIRRMQIVLACLMGLVFVSSIIYLYNTVYLSVYDPYPEDAQSSQVVLRRGIPQLKFLHIGLGDIVYETDFTLDQFPISSRGKNPQQLIQYEQYSSGLFRDPFREYDLWGDQLEGSLPIGEQKVRVLLWLGKEEQAKNLVNSKEFLDRQLYQYSDPVLEDDALFFTDLISPETIKYWNAVANDPSERSLRRSQAVLLLYKVSNISPEQYKFDPDLLNILVELINNLSINEVSSPTDILAYIVQNEPEYANTDILRIFKARLYDENLVGAKLTCARALLHLYKFSSTRNPLSKDDFTEIFSTLMTYSFLDPELKEFIENHPGIISQDWILTLLGSTSQLVDEQSVAQYSQKLNLIFYLVTLRPDILDKELFETLNKPLIEASRQLPRPQQVVVKGSIAILDLYLQYLRPDLPVKDWGGATFQSILYQSIDQFIQGEDFNEQDFYHGSAELQLAYLYEYLPPEFWIDYQAYAFNKYKNSMKGISSNKEFVETSTKKLPYCDKELRTAAFSILISAEALEQSSLKKSMRDFFVDQLFQENQACFDGVIEILSLANEDEIRDSVKEIMSKEKAIKIIEAYKSDYDSYNQYYLANSYDYAGALHKFPDAIKVLVLAETYPDLRPVDGNVTNTPTTIYTPTLTSFAQSATQTAVAAPTPVEVRPTPTAIQDELMAELDMKMPRYLSYLDNTFPIDLQNPQYRSALLSYCLNMLKDSTKVSRSKGTIDCFLISFYDRDLMSQIQSSLIEMQRAKNPQQRITAGKISTMLHLIELYDLAIENQNNFKPVEARLNQFIFSSDTEIKSAADFLVNKLKQDVN